jgi:CobQ-like glutamine amidotransferase family enzyme
LIRLLELYPEHLNLNGDRGNLLVLQRRLEWAQVPVQAFVHRAGQPLPATRPDFVLLGHGSSAAWRQVYGDLSRIVTQLEQWMNEGTQVLAVSSGFAALHGLVKGLPSSINRRERVSKFVEVSIGEQSVVGYLNSDLELEPFVHDENLIGTLLHGPVLAKNVWLADEIIEKFLVAKPELVQTLQVEKFEKVAKFASQATELASELARE